MNKVVVLGGCGAVGSVAVRTLARFSGFDQIVIGDRNQARAKQITQECGAKVSFMEVDASSPDSVRSAIAGAKIVLNCVGPFYKTVKTILTTVIEAGIDYVDICDDVDVTLAILDLDGAAKRAGITALIGMGASPGATNLLAKLIVDNQLDEADSVDIFHCHGGEPTEGPGVIGHRFHCMSIDIPMYLDGKLQYVKYFEPDGIAMRETFNFPLLGPTPLFPYPHPEQVTLPRFLKLRQVTNKGSVLPIEYYNLTGEMCRLGLSSREPLDVNGTPVVPYDFAVSFLIRERDRMLQQGQFGEQRGCMSVIVKGRKDGEAREVRVHMFSGESGLGDGTGIPAAIGVMLMEQGKVTAKGVLPPEGCIDTNDFMAVSMNVMSESAKDRGGKRNASIVFETIHADGSVARVEM